MGAFNIQELLKRAIKYLIQGFMVALAAFLIPKKSLNMEEICLLGLTSSCVFAILETFVPAAGVAAVNGAGLGIGMQLVGFP